MKIYDKMYELFREKAAGMKVASITIGLGYTAIVLEDDSIGLSYTWMDGKTSCSLMKDPENYEGKKALPLLEKLFSDDLLNRSVAVATVNALNYANCSAFAEDRDTLLDDLKIATGSRVSMIGFFAPVVEKLKKRRVELNVFDLGKQIGTKEEFYTGLRNNTDAVILTSTSVIHGSTEEVLENVSPGTPCAMIGPTTPMIPEVFSHLPITILGGTMPLDTEQVVRVIRNARGTKDIQRYSKKVYWMAD